MGDVFPTNEGLRILVAIRDRTMTMNAAGRYVIERQARPDAKTRERLRTRKYIEHRWNMSEGSSRWVLLPKGEDALLEVGL